MYEEEGQVVLLGDFNTRVGKSSKLNDVLGIFGEVKCSMCGSRLISFLNEVELIVYTGREFTVEPQWTRSRPSLKQKCIREYSSTPYVGMVPEKMVSLFNVYKMTSAVGIV